MFSLCFVPEADVTTVITTFPSNMSVGHNHPFVQAVQGSWSRSETAINCPNLQFNFPEQVKHDWKTWIAALIGQVLTDPISRPVSLTNVTRVMKQMVSRQLPQYL